MNASSHINNYSKDIRLAPIIVACIVVIYLLFVIVYPKAFCRPHVALTALLYAVVIGSLLFIGELGLSHVLRQQVGFNRRFRRVQDSARCPELVAYLTRFQSLFNTYPFGLAAGAMNGLIIVGLLCILRYSGHSTLSHGIILLIGLLVSLLTFAWTYKLLNCILGRMCGQTICSHRVAITQPLNTT